MQRIEIGDAIDAEQHRLAIVHKLPTPVLQRRVDDPREALRQVVAATRDQAHAVAIALQPQPVAVVLDLVKPVRLSGTVVALVGMQTSNMRRR